MNESPLRAMAQLQDFLDATSHVHLATRGGDGDSQRCQRICAAPINVFSQPTFSPWFNPHRPCLLVVEMARDNGRIILRNRGCDEGASGVMGNPRHPWSGQAQNGRHRAALASTGPCLSRAGRAWPARVAAT